MQLGVRVSGVIGAVLILSTWSVVAVAEEPKKSVESSAGRAPRPVDAPAEGADTPDVVQETEGSEGEKFYKFEAVEVEGRLKAPQILYFLRRVRAEMRAGELGHRSFLPELRDTRRVRALR